MLIHLVLSWIIKTLNIWAAVIVGYDTYGFLKKIGGIAKGHPNEKDCYRVLNEIRKLIEKD